MSSIPDRSLYIVGGGYATGDDIGRVEIATATLMIHIHEGRATVLWNGEPWIESVDPSIVAAVFVFLAGPVDGEPVVLAEHIDEAAKCGWTFASQRQPA